MGSFFAWRPKINFLCPFNNRKGRNIACTLASTDLTSWPAESTFQNMIEATKRIGGLSFGDILKHPRCAASSEGIYLLLAFLFNKFLTKKVHLAIYLKNLPVYLLSLPLFWDWPILWNCTKEKSKILASGTSSGCAHHELCRRLVNYVGEFDD